MGFLLVWFGEHIVRKKRGRVADFCPICRHVQPFQVWTVEKTHVFEGLSLGPAEPPPWEVVCTSCGVPMWRDYSPYSCYSTDRRESTEDLLAHTHPRFGQLHAERAEVEARLARGALHPGERAALLREPFMIGERTLAWYDAKRPGRHHYTRVFVAGILATAPLGLVAAGLRWPLDVVMLPVGAAGLYLAVSLIRRPPTARRMARRHLLPAIARALRPLRPSDHELREILGEPGAERRHLADFIKASDIDECLRRG